MPVERDGKVIGFYNSALLDAEPFAECPFFSAKHPQQGQPFVMPEPEPLTLGWFLRVRTHVMRELFGRHLHSVK